MMNKRLLGLTVFTASLLGFVATSTSASPAPAAAPAQVPQVPAAAPDRTTEVQYVLKSFGYTIAVDGDYGPQTTRTVKSWQRSNGLLADGVAGPVTRRSLGLDGPVAPSDTPKTATEPPSAPNPAPKAPQIEHYDQWVAISKCESGGDWSINTGNGYYGGLQFALSSWRAVGGTGYPHQNSPEEQMLRAEKLLDAQGWGAWPACTRKLGLR